MRRTRSLALSLSILTLTLAHCTCEEPLADEGRHAGDPRDLPFEGEGDASEGEGEGEGEALTPIACVRAALGADVPSGVAADVSAHLAPFLVDAAAGERCAPELSRVLAFGDVDETRAVIASDDAQAAGSEGYVLRSGALADGTTVLAVDGDGVRFGAYALLEQLGFAFLHPLAPTVPAALLLPDVDVTSAPRWPVRNVHLHTMHPLELTELLNGWGQGDPEDRASWDAMRPEWSRFLAWMNANGQNEVEWVLLEASSWSDFAQSDERHARLQALVDDCHAFGVKCGIDVPIALEQQHTFRLLLDANGDVADELAQIDARIDWLMSAGFDFLSTENGTTEFTNPGAERMLGWIDEVARHVDEAWGARARIKVHVSTNQVADGYVDPDTDEPLNFNFLPIYADARMGVMPHTVQMYGLDDPAPTYGNTGFGQIKDFLERQAGAREVVWHPETAYWVSVDDDVPLFLPVYAERRLADLRALAADEDAGLMGRGEHAGARMDGQSFFSSGWEWGYWLNDVVAARATWDPRSDVSEDDALRSILAPLARALGANGADAVDRIVALAHDQHDVLVRGEVDGVPPDDIVKKNGFAYLAGTEAFDDLSDLGTDVGLAAPTTQPAKLGLVEMRNPLHAPPHYTGIVDRLLTEVRDAHAAADDAIAALALDGPLGVELTDAVRITRLRAEQVLGLYDYVDRLRDDDATARLQSLAAARAALDEAQAIVLRREAAYRVNVDRIAAWRANPTAYDFTYLWSVHSLYYWWRDEGKAVDGPLNPCYLNVINPADVSLGEGVVNDGAQLARDLAEDGSLADATECLAAPDAEPAFPQDDLRARP